MGSLLVIIAAAAVALLWVRGTRRNRLRWLARLDLPGNWEREGESGRLELTGELHRGRYRFQEGRGGHGDESGGWLLEGHALILTSDAGKTTECELRQFQDGKIGIDGPGREQRIYQKVPSNVVPLRGRSGG